MQNERYVPMVDLRPDAALLGSSVVISDREAHYRQDCLDQMIVEQLVRSLVPAIEEILKRDPKRAAELVEMKTIRRKAFLGYPGDSENVYTLRLAVMHPDKLRELEQAGRNRHELVAATSKMAETVTKLREELAVAKDKADRFDAIQNALRTKLGEVDQADF